MMGCKLVIQIPCLNEAKLLSDVLGDLPEAIPGVDVIETLVIDDGSSDGTAAVALSLGVDHVIRHRRTKGLAAAFSTGMSAALRLGADVIVNTDGDHQYPSAQVSNLIQPILQRRADVVIGDRHPYDDARCRLIKRWMYRIGQKCVEYLAAAPCPDPTSGFRAYSRQAASDLYVINPFSYTLETFLRSIEHRHQIAFVRISTNPPRRPSRLFHRLDRFIIRMGITGLRVVFWQSPLKLFAAMSALSFAVGFLPIIRFLYFVCSGQGDGHVQSLILGAALLNLSALLMVAGLVADAIRQNRVLLERLGSQNSMSGPGNTPATPPSNWSITPLGEEVTHDL